MKVYCEPEKKDFAILRITDALKRYAPKKIRLVEQEDAADLLILYVFAHRRYIWHRKIHILKGGKKYAIIQLCLRSTTNPDTKDWINIWKDAKVVWSYCNLPELCRQDKTKGHFNFYYAPLGVDPKVFKETKYRHKFIIAGTGSGRRFSNEFKNQIVSAAKRVNKNVFLLGFGKRNDNYAFSNGMDDSLLARYYSQCEFVSGLHKTEGFEMPVIEGLLCGARPVCFNRPDMHHWFKKIAVFIPEDNNIEANLIKLFQERAKPVTEAEKDYVRNNFNWEKIAKGFWREITA